METQRKSPGEAAILAAGVKLFAEQGFDGASMRGVAEAAGRWLTERYKVSGIRKSQCGSRKIRKGAGHK
jgi:hypothetical protein